VPINTPPVLAETAPSGGEAQAREALGRSQGGFSTKLHLRAEGNGKPITAVLTSGERQEQIALEALLDQGAIGRPGRGRPRLRPRRAAGPLAPPPHPARHPPQEQPASPAQFRPCRLSAPQRHRAPDQPPQAVAPHCDPLREAGCQLSRHDYLRHDPALALVFADTA
jgi:hypothetical protein